MIGAIVEDIGFNPAGNPELSKRTGYIEGNEGIFRTKVLTLNSPDNQTGYTESVLTVSRDPGSAASLVPVLKILLQNSDVNVSVITDGRAEAIFRKNFAGEENFQEKEISSSLSADSVIPNPSVIMTDASEEQGLDTYVNATFPEVPMVLIEDFPGSSTRYLQATKERPGLRFPDKICVMDEAARQALLERYPELVEVVEVTGQPAFDRIANENVPEISKEVREKLAIGPEEKVIAFMSTDEVTSDQFEKICQQIAATPSEFKLIFRRHPRDNASYEQYFEILQKYGIEPIDSRELTTDQISAAADIVFTSWSTAGLEAIYRGKPTVHIADGKILDLPPSLNLPLDVVKLGASVGVDEINNIPGVITQLLDPESNLSKAVLENMKKYYPNDGKNTQRVASVVNDILSGSKDRNGV